MKSEKEASRGSWLTTAPDRNLHRLLHVRLTDVPLSSQQSVRSVKNILAPDAPPRALGRVTPGNTWRVRGLGTATWQRHWIPEISWEALPPLRSSLFPPPVGPRTCSLQVCSITVVLRCDWPKRSSAAALPESCGAVRRRRSDSAKSVTRQRWIYVLTAAGCEREKRQLSVNAFWLQDKSRAQR